ncbi:glutathione synthase [Thiomicrospira sp. WB1]|uniref:glutathione synthase n=1 Tax=Thiomicrospira sp. WB1 TaxID=1685380 RepID=UPI00074A9CEE|nr:glutathione synthase [Thiomicrospira sp. WB1]KUJ72814.1 glutathione synthetase [Thiomicrospira sp. WB1]
MSEVAAALDMAVIMDPIEQIKPWKDTSFAMLLEGQRRGHTLWYLTPQDIFLDGGRPFAQLTQLKVWDRPQSDTESQYFGYGQTVIRPLGELDLIFIRQDPPFDNDYLYCTQMLELAEAEGARVVNRPQAIRDANEKLFASWFPQALAPSLVAAQPGLIRQFIQTHRDVILKPLDAMGGSSIFRVTDTDPNISVILETLTGHGQHHIMAQVYLPEIKDGDKRILMIDGEPIDYALARIPAEGETRGNLAAGGRGVGQPLSDRDRWLCQQVGPTLKAKGLYFVGLDVIGDYITEINVTSPTCVRELDAAFDLNIAGDLLDALAALPPLKST